MHKKWWIEIKILYLFLNYELLTCYKLNIFFFAKKQVDIWVNICELPNLAKSSLITSQVIFALLPFKFDISHYIVYLWPLSLRIVLLLYYIFEEFYHSRTLLLFNHFLFLSPLKIFPSPMHSLSWPSIDLVNCENDKGYISSINLHYVLLLCPNSCM